MGEVRDDDEDVEAARRAMIAFSERYPGLGFEPVVAGLRSGGPLGDPVDDLPTILDTDVGGDPDDAVALVAAARHVRRLALVTTAEEHDAGHGGERARFARHLLDLLGRGDVPVVAGAVLAGTGNFCVAGLVPADATPPAGGLLEAVGAVADTTAGPVRWVGLGPLTNLAAVLTARPDLCRCRGSTDGSPSGPTGGSGLHLLTFICMCRDVL